MTEIKSLRLYGGSGKQIQGNRSDRVSEELWTEVHDIVQEVVIKTIPKEKKCKKAKWLPEEPHKSLRKGEKGNAKEKGKIHPSECRDPKNSKER